MLNRSKIHNTTYAIQDKEAKPPEPLFFQVMVRDTLFGSCSISRLTVKLPLLLALYMQGIKML